MAKIFGLAFIFTLIMAFCLAMFLNDASIGASEGAFYGFLAGFGWIFFALAVNSLYERRSWRYSLINGGYWTVVFTLIGFILGAWRGLFSAPGVEPWLTGRQRRKNYAGTSSTCWSADSKTF